MLLRPDLYMACIFCVFLMYFSQLLRIIGMGWVVSFVPVELQASSIFFAQVTTHQ